MSSSHTKCLASTEHPYEALVLIDLPRVLALCEGLLMADLHPSSDLIDSFKAKDRFKRMK